MRKVVAMMSMTLDGVAEFPEYPEGSDAPMEDLMYEPRLDSIDTVLLGRRTYEKWSEHWPRQVDNPESSAWEKRFARFVNEVDKVVFSRSLSTADWPHSRIARDAATEIARIRQLPGKDMALWGGPRILQSFLEQDLVDEICIRLFPSLFGSGKPLFKVNSDPLHDEDFVPLGAVGRRDFSLAEARSRGDGVVFLSYRRSFLPSDSLSDSGSKKA